MLVEQTIIVRNMKTFIPDEQLEDYGGRFSRSEALGYNFQPMGVVYKSFKNSPNLTMTSLSVSKLKNSDSQTDYENMNF